MKHRPKVTPGRLEVNHSCRHIDGWKDSVCLRGDCVVGARETFVVATVSKEAASHDIFRLVDCWNAMVRIKEPEKFVARLRALSVSTDPEWIARRLKQIVKEAD